MNIPATQETGRTWRGPTPAWWFGAPLIAGVYVFLTPRFLPDIVSVGTNGPVRWLVGLLVGVAILSTWRIVRWVLAIRAENQT